MNITELARALRISPQELRNILPQIGFNIGPRAIKIDKSSAKKILKNWSVLMRELEQKQKLEREKEEEEIRNTEKKKISIPSSIIVRDLSDISQVPINKILAELMKNGIFVSINERIDFDTAHIIGENIGLDISLEEEVEKKEDTGKTLKDILKKEDEGSMEERAPVIVVMGHVDHGKTMLLDSIRETDVIAGEAGGITQHIGAYQVTRNNKPITFIDTPGHEAFTAMRSRGAKVADVAILVVAADDGVKSQTIEAFRIIQASKIPYIVAINKIDKPDADVDRTKGELSTKLNITPEDWGGKIICVPISAKNGENIEELLDMVLLIADTDSEGLRANKSADACGTVIESHLDKGAGPVATILVQNGTLKIGNQLCFNNVIFGKVKSLKNYAGKDINEAGPSQPVKILGLKVLPKVGDMLEVGNGKKVKTRKIKSKLNELFNNVKTVEDGDNIQKMNIVIKSDFLGSAEAIEESLMKINTEKVKIKILSKGLGNIVEGDVIRAESSGAEVIGFNVKVQTQAESLAREKNVKIKTFTIIYDLIEYIRKEMEELVEPEFERIELGRLKVLVIFRTESDSQIIGGKVLEGEIETDSKIELIRDGIVVEEGKLVALQSGKQDVKSVEKDQECGIKYEGKPVIVEGDILNFYKTKKIITKL